MWGCVIFIWVQFWLFLIILLYSVSYHNKSLPLSLVSSLSDYRRRRWCASPSQDCITSPDVRKLICSLKKV